MIRKFTSLLILFQSIVLLSFAQSIPNELIIDYGPPPVANEWTKYVIPLNAQTFNTDEATFQGFMSNITSLWIRTEMHSGADIGGLDEVNVAEAYVSNFDLSSEDWTSGGDGTMEWMSSGGVVGGFLQISDWATGEYHWMISPFSWAGDWSSLIGQNMEFWVKTNKPTYEGKIKLTSNIISRLSLSLPESNTLPLYDSIPIVVGITPVPTEDVTVTLTNSTPSCISLPSSIVIPAGATGATVQATTAEGAEIGCFSVIEAKSSGYLTSRMTLNVLGTAGINDPAAYRMVNIYPNPGNGQFMISNKSGKNIERIEMFDLQGRSVFELYGKDLSNTDIILNDRASGIFLVRIYMKNEVFTTKVIIE